MDRWIPALAFLSGMCGIAYELVYTRLLTTYLGDMFHVAAAILTTFLLGIAAGAGLAQRFAPRLWQVELGIGLYAGAVALGVGTDSAQILAWLPAAAGSAAWVVLWVLALLLLPALLIGFSVPLFALLLRQHAAESDREGSFRAVYRFYNVGAALCVLGVEFFVLRAFGIRATLELLALVNAGTAALLLRIPAAPPAERSAPLPPRARRLFAALFAASVLSGIYQLFLYKLAETVFGPFHENFALVLALVLLGIALGTAASGRRPVSFASWLIHGGTVVALSCLALGGWVQVWAFGNTGLGALPFASTALKALVLGAMALLPLACFGGTVPALLRDLPHRAGLAGRALAVSGLGNACGYLLTVLWLYAAAPDRVLVLLVAGLLAVAGGLAAGRFHRGLAPAAAALAGLALFWPAELFHYSYDDYASWKALASARRSVRDVQVHRRFDSQISLLTRTDGAETLVINGYSSLVASAGGLTNLRELLFGLTPALYSAGLERALVLGVGTGITAAATSTVYERTTAVEVNPSMLALLPHFATHNLALHRRTGVELVLDDGLTALARSQDQFDAIVNTVTSPLYFSSSKLYTRDFFALAARHLAPGGVYALWFDGQVTERGGEIIFRTLAESFADCALTYLNTTYLQVICANEPLRMRGPASIAWDPELERRIEAHGLGLSLPELLEALAFRANRLFRETREAPSNTFDRPVLEFLMAGAALSRPRWWSPYHALGVVLDADPGGGSPLTGAALGRRCAALRRLASADAQRCVTWLLGGEPAGLATYADLLGRREREGGALLRQGERSQLVFWLLEAGEMERARALADRGEPTPRELRAARLTQARVRLAQGELLDDAFLAQLFSAAPMDRAIRKLLVEALVGRGELAAARQHLLFLRQLGPLDAESQALAARLEVAWQPAVQSGADW